MSAVNFPNQSIETVTENTNNTKMKLYLSFVLCSALIFCLSKTVAVDTNSNESLKCLSQYLKSKGKIEFENSGSKKEDDDNIATKCGVNEDRLEKIMAAVLTTSSEESP